MSDCQRLDLMTANWPRKKPMREPGFTILVQNCRRLYTNLHYLGKNVFTSERLRASYYAVVAMSNHLLGKVWMNLTNIICGKIPHFSSQPIVGFLLESNTRLNDIQADPRQATALEDAVLVKKYSALIASLMAEVEASPEAYTKLGYGYKC